MNKNNEQLGVINEIGDLGLGFDPLSDVEKEKIKLDTNKGSSKEDK